MGDVIGDVNARRGQAIITIHLERTVCIFSLLTPFSNLLGSRNGRFKWSQDDFCIGNLTI